MAIFRGIGGAGDSTTDATVTAVTEQAVNASNSATAAASSASAAAASASAAATSATNAASSEAGVAADAAAATAASTAAAASETAALASETAAAASESAALASETAAAASESAAATSASNAASSASSASSSASTATTKASEASASASAASTSASNAATSASNAAASESAASTSEGNAATSETNAANSASAASGSASSASSSASAAAGSASAASTSASNAAASETAAAASETAAGVSEANAATSESNAATSESNAATSASNAATSASNAASSASSAASSASSASASADAALAALDNFDDRYLGQKASDPSVDNDGNALVAGALYFNTTDNVMKVYEGSSWVAAYASLSGALLAANNLADVSSVSSARTNLGLGTGDSPTLTGLQVDDVNGAEIIISRNDTSLVSGDFIGGIKFGTNDSSTAYGTPPHYSAGIKAKASGTVGLMDMHLYAGQTNDAYEEDTPSMTLGYNGDIYFYEDTGTTAKLTWDASAERLGIGTSSVDSVLHIASESNGTNTFTMESLDAFLSSTQEANAIHFKTNDSSASGVTGKISQISENGNEKLALAFSTFNGTLSERLRIDSSGNVGIGTSSPTQRLDVSMLNSGASGTVAVFRNAGTSTVNTAARIVLTSRSGDEIRGSYIEAINVGGANYPFDLVFGTSSSNATPNEKMRLNSAGTLGLGVTPSEWGIANSSVLQIKNTAIAGRGNDLYLYANTYISGSQNRYIASDFASLYYQDQGNHVWSMAPSGTAGNTISFTQRMTLTAAGDLLVGKTSAGIANNGFEARADGLTQITRAGGIVASLNRKTSDGAILEFNKDGTTVGTISAIGGELTIDATSGTNKDVNINGKDAGGNTRGLHIGSGSVRPNADNSIDLATTSNRFKDLYLSGKITNNGTGGINIATSGNVGIGTSSPNSSNKLQVTGDIGLTWATDQFIGMKFDSGTSYKMGLMLKDTTRECKVWSQSSDSDDKITFYTGSTPSERLRITSAGNVGIGTNSPVSTAKTSIKQAAGGGAGSTQLHLEQSNTTDGYDLKCDSADGALAFLRYASGSATERMRITSAGNVGIGTTTPGYPLQVVTSSSSNAATISMVNNPTTNISSLAFVQNGSNNASYSYIVGDGRSSGYLSFATNNAERMRINSSGNLQLGTTTGGYRLNVTSNGGTTVNIRRDTNTGGLVDFNYGATGVGSISTNGTTTAYNTSSDYRLKEDIAPMTGALAKVAALKPCTYKWKVDGSDGQGFIAHELDEVVPGCVTGEKDAVDADGNPKYQGIDTSFLVATLTAAIQEQQAIIESLTARVSALEGN